MAFAEVSHTCCVITGASRGFGRATAFALADAFAASGCNSHFILLSRDEKNLQETKDGIMALHSYAKGKIFSLKIKIKQPRLLKHYSCKDI